MSVPAPDGPPRPLPCQTGYLKRARICPDLVLPRRSLTDEGGEAVSGVIPSIPTLMTDRPTGRGLRDRGCACRCCSTRSAPTRRSWGSAHPNRCSRWPRPRGRPLLGQRATACRPGRAGSIDATADDVMFCAALGNVFNLLRPGAAVAAACGNSPGPGCGRYSRGRLTCTHRSSKDLTGFDRPWRLLSEFVPGLRVDELAFGTGCVALGHTRGRQTPPSASPRAVRMQHPAPRWKGPCDDNQRR
jgi:hypothetical protein